MRQAAAARLLLPQDFFAQFVAERDDVARDQPGVAEQVVLDRPVAVGPVPFAVDSEPVPDRRGPAGRAPHQQRRRQPLQLLLKQVEQRGAVPGQDADVRLVVVPRRVLRPVHRRHDDVPDAHHDVQPPAQLVVPEQPHDLVEQPLLASQPVHRGVAELLVYRVEVEVDWLALGDDLAQQVLEVVPERVVEVGGQLMSRVPLVDDVAHFAVDRPRPARVADQPGVGPLQLLGLLVTKLLPELGTAQQVRGQRPHDRALPDLHPLLDQDAVREPLARLHDDLGLRQALLRHVGVDRVLMRLEILKAPQVDRLARAELAHDDPDLGVVGPRGEVAVGRIAAEVDELAEDVLDVGS
jgi:hypothetical protein